MSIPASLVVGDTWAWTSSFGDYPAPTWVATAYFQKSGDDISATASASGTDHAFSIAATTTADYEPGRYQVQIRVVSGAVKYVAETAWCEVKADPSSAKASIDPRSWARRTLEAVEAFLEGNASTAQQSMSIAGRSLSRWSLSELTQLRNDLRNEVRTEESGSNAGLGRNIKVRYGRS